MKLVVIESPLMGKPPASCPAWLRPIAERVLREKNRHYAFACFRCEMDQGLAPYASHVFIDQPGLLEDSLPDQRKLGMDIGQAWSAAGERRVLFADLGISTGMRLGAKCASAAGQPWNHDLLDEFKPLPLWRCALAALLRWVLGKVYG